MKHDEIQNSIVHLNFLRDHLLRRFYGITENLLDQTSGSWNATKALLQNTLEERIIIAKPRDFAESLADKIIDNFQDTTAAESVAAVAFLGQQLSNTHFSSSEIRDYFLNPASLKSQVMTESSETGRTWRVELIAQCYTVLYLMGLRQEQYISAMLRIMAAMRAVPRGTAYWTLFGVFVEMERYEFTHKISFGPLRAAVPQSFLLHPLGLDESYRSADHFGFELLAMAIATLQITLARSLPRPLEINYLVAEPHVDDSLLAWWGGSCGISLRYSDKIDSFGTCILCNSNGLGFYGSQDGGQDHTSRAYLMEQDALASRKRYFDELFSDQPAVELA